MLIKIINGQKKVIAENNKIVSINGVSTVDENRNLTLTGADINVNVAGTNNITNRISEVLKAKANDDLITVDVSGIGSKSLGLEIIGHSIQLTADGTPIGTAENIDIDSAIGYMGILTSKNDGTFDITGKGDEIDNAIAALEVENEKPYLIIVYDDASSGVNYVATATSVESLLDNVSYSSGNGLDLTGTIFSLKLNKTSSDNNSVNVLSSDADGLLFNIPVVSLAQLGTPAAPLTNGNMYIVSDDLY